MIKTSTQLKDLVKNLSKTTGINSQILIRKYMMERFLERVSKSNYQSCFILKGGMLISAFLGIEARSTMDIDTTVKGINVSIDEMEKIIKEISSMDIGDQIEFNIKKVSEIMDEAKYAGIRISMDATLDRAVIPLKIDISTGDVITPKEIKYSYQLMFEDRSIPIMTYTIETILAEKLETIISRSTTNTRMRDFYDIHVLIKSQEFNKEILKKALIKTAKQRGSLPLLDNADKIISSIEKDVNMKRQWNIYKSNYPYAMEYSWYSLLISVREISIDAGLDVQKPSVLKQLKEFNGGNNMIKYNDREKSNEAEI